MSLLNVSNMTFGYEESFDNIFENVSFSIDTDWKTGFIGRNGKGKTTFLNLLMGKYEYSGSISCQKNPVYFPFALSPDDMDKTMYDLIERWKPEAEDWRVICELGLLGLDAEILYRPVRTLSFGERTKAMLAVLFSGEEDFLLIDEPTNHLDKNGRDIVRDYLKSKKGFILVSHDRKLLDAVVDHMLVLNRESIEVQSGNFSSWWENKEKADAFAVAENEKHLKEIGKLKASADRAGRWADKNENTKIGYDPIKEHDRSISARAYIGAKTKKMQSRVKNFEKRIDREISEKEGLLKDIEDVKDLKLCPMKYHKKVLVESRDFSLGYNNPAVEMKKPDNPNYLFEEITFQLEQGDRLVISGENGSGKSSLINVILSLVSSSDEKNIDRYVMMTSQKMENLYTRGRLQAGSGLVVSYINQDTSHLKGRLKDYADGAGMDYTLLLTLLRKLDMERVQFEKNMEDFSEGQKKKVLIAGSLLTPAHLYIWDEPMNYIDVFSRMQIEKLIETYQPTMILVEHDEMFQEKVATKRLNLRRQK